MLYAMTGTEQPPAPVYQVSKEIPILNASLSAQLTKSVPLLCLVFPTSAKTHVLVSVEYMPPVQSTTIIQFVNVTLDTRETLLSLAREEQRPRLSRRPMWTPAVLLLVVAMLFVKPETEQLHADAFRNIMETPTWPVDQSVWFTQIAQVTRPVRGTSAQIHVLEHVVSTPSVM